MSTVPTKQISNRLLGDIYPGLPRLSWKKDRLTDVVVVVVVVVFKQNSMGYFNRFSLLSIIQQALYMQ